MRIKFEKRLCIFLVLIFPVVIFSQSAKEDSLKKIAASEKVDTATIDANKLLSVMVQEDKPDDAIQYGFVALRKAKILNDKFRTGQAYMAVGVGFDYKGNLDSCLYYLNEASAMFKATNRIDFLANSISNKALAYYFRGNYQLALQNHLEALELRKQVGDQKNIAKCYLNIGLVYRSRKDYANAIKFYTQSYNIKKIINDEQGMLNSLINIGAAFQNEEKFDSAYVYALQSLQLAKKIKSDEDVIASKTNIAASLINLNRPDEALPYLKEVEKSVERNNKKSLITNAESYGDMYLQKNNVAAAIPYFQKALEMAKSNNRVELMEVFYRKLAKCFYNQNNYKLAYEYFDSSKSLGDTLLNAENSRQVNEMSAVYETAEKETQINKLNAENAISNSETKRRQRERNYFMLSTILFLGLAVGAYKAFTNNKKKKELLNAQNKIIEKSLSEKEILLREIHHRVKNNLQIVSSLLSLQSNYIKDEQALEAVKDSRNRVQSMSLIHQNLYQEENLMGVDVKDYISKLADNLFQSYNIRPDNIKLIKEIEATNLDVDVVVPIGLILNELLTNCLKYAFKPGEEGAIKVILKEQDDVLYLSVYDNGVGLPADFNPETKKSFGHKMILTFLQKLKGEMKMYNEDGTKVDITIKNFKKPI